MSMNVCIVHCGVGAGVGVRVCGCVCVRGVCVCVSGCCRTGSTLALAAVYTSSVGACKERTEGREGSATAFATVS